MTQSLVDITWQHVDTLLLLLRGWWRTLSHSFTKWRIVNAAKYVSYLQKYRHFWLIFRHSIYYVKCIKGIFSGTSHWAVPLSSQ